MSQNYQKNTSNQNFMQDKPLLTAPNPLALNNLRDALRERGLLLQDNDSGLQADEQHKAELWQDYYDSIREQHENYNQ
jgi:hypothetical protein